MFACNLNTVELDGCICNASGPRCTELEELIDIDFSKSSMVISKSATPNLREGNPKPRYSDTPMGSINSMGLPNNGIDFYVSSAQIINKTYFISISGASIEENCDMIDKIYKGPSLIDGIEINLSCPNIIGKGQLAYDFKKMDQYLETIFQFIKDKEYIMAIGVKLPPYFDMWQFDEAADVLMKYPLDFITCINSIGNGLVIDMENESTLIKPKGGFGGIGGSYIKPTGLANVRKFYEIFEKHDKKIKIIGCGGIENGGDVFEYILCGAEMVQIGTQFYREGVACFERLEKELGEIMEKKEYQKLTDFRGKIKIIN